MLRGSGGGVEKWRCLDGDVVSDESELQERK
jgi:hypothetical protein